MNPTEFLVSKERLLLPGGYTTVQYDCLLPDYSNEIWEGKGALRKIKRYASDCGYQTVRVVARTLRGKDKVYVL